MTRFNPDKNNKDAIDWSVVAYKTADDDKAAQTLVMGLVVGVGLASFTTPLLGSVVGAYLITKGIQKAIAGDKNKKYIRSVGCIAQALEGGDFRAYLRQVGAETVTKELEYAEREGLSFTDEAIDFYEDYIESRSLTPKILQSSLGDQPTLIQSPTTVLQPRIDQYDPTASARIDIINEMSDRVGNTIIIGIPGSGKGMLVSNAIRAIKQKHPDLKVFVIDPKADPKEVGYFDCCDVLNQFACMDAKPSTVAAWAESAFNDYVAYAQKYERTLLIVDEGTMLGNKLNQAKSTLLVDKLTSYTSGGDSAGRNVWFMMQSPYVTGASLNLSTTSQMTTIVIASSENIGALTQWKSSKIFKNLSLDAVQSLIDNSPVFRAFYYGKTGNWYIMPELKNYSGYNRDKREYLDVTSLQSDLETLDNDDSIDDEFVTKVLEIISNSKEEIISYNAIRVSRVWDDVKPKKAKLLKALSQLCMTEKISGSEQDGYRLI